MRQKSRRPHSGGRSVDELLKRTPKAESFAQTAVPYRREELKPKEEQPIELKPIVSDEKTEEVKPTEEKQPFFQIINHRAGLSHLLDCGAGRLPVSD